MPVVPTGACSPLVPSRDVQCTWCPVSHGSQWYPLPAGVCCPLSFMIYKWSPDKSGGVRMCMLTMLSHHLIWEWADLTSINWTRRLILWIQHDDFLQIYSVCMVGSENRVAIWKYLNLSESTFTEHNGVNLSWIVIQVNLIGCFQERLNGHLSQMLNHFHKLAATNGFPEFNQVSFPDQLGDDRDWTCNLQHASRVVYHWIQPIMPSWSLYFWMQNKNAQHGV